MELHGTEGADVLTGGADGDTLYGFGGNDTIKGGAGDDVLAGHEGNDILQGGDGDDYILGGPGNDTIDGGAGNDWAAYEDATAGVKVDLNLTTAQNTIGGGTDKLTGIENLYGSAFNDTLSGDAHDNMIDGGAGNDTVNGGKGGDTLWGNVGNDTLDGGDGDDYLVGGAGDDVIKGGAGVDWSSYEDATAGVKVDLTKTVAQDTVGAGKDTLNGIENLYGSKFADTLTGDSHDNYLYGDDGDDTLSGGAGDDHLSGGNGVNVLNGGDGFDTVDYSFSDHGVTINLQQGPPPMGGSPVNYDIITGVEAAMGSAHDDVITGNAAENYLFGDAGDDQIFAVGGLDTLDGGIGDDTLHSSVGGSGDLLLGGAGNDTFVISAQGDSTVDGGEGSDTLQFTGSAGVIYEMMRADHQTVGHGLGVQVTGVENVIGADGDDQLSGDARDNVIEGGAGDDIMNGVSGFDIASYAGAKSGVRVDLGQAGRPQDTHGAGKDTLINFDGLKGSSHNDILIGDAAANTFEGGKGDDIIDGGAGADTAIYSGASKDYSWTLNANGTWTVKGLDGVDTLLNIETLKFADKSVTLSPSTTTVTVDDLANPKTLVTSNGPVRDAILSADGHTAYVSIGEGHVVVIDTTTGQTRADLTVGTALGGMDVSPDGRYLVVAERMMVERTSPGGSPAPMAVVHVVDLQTGVVKDYSTFANGSDRGFQDAAFTSDGKIVLTQNFAGSGNTSVTVLDPITGAFTRGTAQYGQSGMLSVTDDHAKVLLAEANSSWGGLFLLTPGAVQTAAHNQFGSFDGVSGFNFGIQAIAGDGSKVAQWTFPGQVHVYDGALKHLVELSAYSPYSFNVHGMDFSADGKHLYVVDDAHDQIFDFSTETWSLNEVYAIGADIVPATENYGAGAAYGDSVTLSHDGQTMLIMDDHKVVSVNMAMLKLAGGTEAADTLQGTAGADLLRGFGGDDTINAGNSDDTLIGGVGADKLTGGQGADTFAFAKGDTTWSLNSDTGVDVILDWESTDKLSFGPHSEFIHYAEQTSTSWLAAATTAPQIMASQHLSYLAMQVGADVYVFAASSGAQNGAVENVVKLANTTLDKISADNFLPTGDDSANILTGGALNDRIYGYGGDDTITGGKGWDLLFGGAGIDTFVFSPGDTTWSDTSNAGVDSIMDWEATDKLVFGPLGTAFALTRSTVDTWQQAVGQASQTGVDHHPTYKAIQVGADVYVFYLPDGSTGVIENVVRLANATLDKIDLTTFIPNVGLPLDGDDSANVLTGGVLADFINGKGGDDVINGGKGDDVLTGGAGADVFKFLAGDGLFNPKLQNFDTISDFGAGDKLAFAGAPAVVHDTDILRATASVNPDGTISAASQLTIDAYSNQYLTGGLSQKYLIIGVGADTYVVADTDAVHPGYDQVVLLKGVASSLVTADMFMAA